jgi:hypothetical protein
MSAGIVIWLVDCSLKKWVSMFTLLVKDHEVFLRIASTLEERLYRYRPPFRTGMDAKDVHNVLKAVAFSVPLGNNLFKERTEATLGKSVGYIARGRPKQG